MPSVIAARLPSSGDDAGPAAAETAKKTRPSAQFEPWRHDLTHNNTEPRRPGGAGWTRTQDPDTPGETWINAAAGLLAVTQVVHEPVAAYRFSLRQAEGGRCSAAEVLLALVDFGLLDAQEADFIRHGETRIFLCPVDPAGAG